MYNDFDYNRKSSKHKHLLSMCYIIPRCVSNVTHMNTPWQSRNHIFSRLNNRYTPQPGQGVDKYSINYMDVLNILNTSNNSTVEQVTEVNY